VTRLKKVEKKFVRFPVFVPKFALDFAKEHRIKLKIQELTLSAIAGYFATFANVDPDSRFPYKESHKIAKRIQVIETPENQFCPFCLMLSLDKLTAESIAKDCDHCSLLINIKKELST
jgi:hypothetical protein